MMNLIIQPS